MIKNKETKYIQYINETIEYMKKNVKTPLTFEKILLNANMGETYFKRYFKKITGFSVMQYFKKMKIEEAKNLIKTSNMNFTKISENLGYDSIHYFSRQFKALTGMTPTQYKNKEV